MSSTIGQFFVNIYNCIPHDFWMLLYVMAMFSVFRFLYKVVTHNE